MSNDDEAQKAIDELNGATVEGRTIVVNKSLEQGIVTEDLVAKGAKAYSTSEVGDWLVANL